LQDICYNSLIRQYSFLRLQDFIRTAMANPFIPQEDIVNRINRITGVTGGRQYSTPLPANKIPKQPGTSLVPAGQRVSSGPDARVTKDFFRQPSQPTNSFYGADASYDGPVQQGKGLSPTVKPQIDPYTGQPIKPAFQGVRNFAGKVGNTVGNAAKRVGNFVKGAVTDPVSLYGMADSVNQAALEYNMQQGNLGLKDIPRMALSSASRFPEMIANRLAPRDNSKGSDTIESLVQTVTGSIAPQTKPVQDKANIVNTLGADKLKPTVNKQYNSGSMDESEAKALFDEFDKIPENKDPIVTSVNTVMKNGVPTYTANIAPGQNSSGSTVLGGGQQASINTSAGNKFLQSQPVQPSSKLHPDASNGYRVTYDDLVNAGQQNEGGIDVYHGSTLENVSTNGYGGRGTMPTYHPESSPAPEVYQPRGLSKTEIVGLRRNGVNLSDLADYEQAKVQASQYNYLDWAAREKARNGDLEGAQAIQMQMKELGAKIASDQADRGLRKQALALERDKYNSSLVPKQVTPEYMPIYDERTDADGVRSKRLVGHTNKNTGLFEPIDEAKMPRNDRAIYEKYQQALKAGHNQEEALKAYFSDMGYN
jgi:hypothetical protein